MDVLYGDSATKRSRQTTGNDEVNGATGDDLLSGARETTRSSGDGLARHRDRKTAVSDVIHGGDGRRRTRRVVRGDADTVFGRAATMLRSPAATARDSSKATRATNRSPAARETIGSGRVVRAPSQARRERTPSHGDGGNDTVLGATAFGRLSRITR